MTLSAQYYDPAQERWLQVRTWAFAEQSSIAWMDRAEALAAAQDWIAQFEGRRIVVEEFADDGMTCLGKVAEISG